MLRVHSDGSDGECSQPQMVASLAGSGDCDIEGGYTGCDSLLDHQQQGETRGISSKFNAVECGSEGRTGYFMRRNSQIERLTHRGRSEPVIKSESFFSRPDYETDAKKNKRPNGMLHHGASVLESRETVESDLPVTIYVDNRSTKYRSIVGSCGGFAAAGTLCLLVIIGLISHQYKEIQSFQNKHQVLRDELRVTQNEKLLLDQSQSNLHRDLQTKQEVIDHLKHTHSQVMAAQSEMASDMKRLKEDNSIARKELDRSHKELDRLRDVEKRSTLSVKRLDTIVDGIQERSRQRALQKYGPGPHQVELTVELPHSSPKKITIELAPLSLMPHSVSTFLDQVTSKFWDGTHFDLHIGHALLGREHIKKRDGDQPKFQHEPPTIMFSEHSDHYPHDEYSVAFHPPSKEREFEFYINLRHNQLQHSPRLESDDRGNDMYVEGGSAFGKIVDHESRQVVDQMDALAADDVGHLDESVEIVSARVVTR